MVSPLVGPLTAPGDGGNEPLHIFVVAGEASGDALGGALMAELRDLSHRPVRFSGVGGPAMSAQGLDSLFDYSELSVMGLIEIVPHARRLLRRIREVVGAIERDPPDLLMTIDSPGFAFGVIRRLGSWTFPRIHYVAPTVWAWRARRVHKFRRHFDHLLALLPFEPPWFEKVGLPCTFVGHPVTEMARASDTAKRAFRESHGISADAVMLSVLPGSRRGELDRHLASFGQTIAQLARRHDRLHVVLPTLPHLKTRLLTDTSDWPVAVTVVEDAAMRATAMAASDIALAASGTVTLELARERVPTIVAYRLAPVSAWLLRRMVRVQYASIVNLIAGREVVPEFLQQNMRPDRMADGLESLLTDTERRNAMREGQETAMRALGEGGPPPSRRAAKAVLDVVRDWRKTERRIGT